MSDIKIFDSIFDAFQSFAPSSPLVQLQNDGAQFFKRTNQYQVMDMGDGYIGAFPGFPMMLYRGEYKEYVSCKAGIYRSNDLDDVILDELRILEFKNILNTFPQVQYAIEDHMKVDYLALAQHYGLKTNLVDVTSEPEIAAYFATHRWINGIPTPVVDGIGCIHGIMALSYTTPNDKGLIDPKFHMIGLQCFQRPGLQAAYGIEFDKDEDLSDMGWTVYFKQNAEATRRIHLNFHIDEKKTEEIRKNIAEGTTVSDDMITSQNSWLFPDEDIADVAETVKKSRTISRKTVSDYGKQCMNVLDRKGITVVDNLSYMLDENKRKQLAEEYKGRPYGDVRLNTRLVYVPGQ